MTVVRRVLRLVVPALLLVTTWLLLPTQFGGGTTYVSTHGVSMQPRFSTGDLAVLRSAGGYDVGDVVAYRSASLKTTVMHRIIATDGTTFTTQGDANDFHDPDHPTADQVLGRLWFRIPHGGAALGALRSPLFLVSLLTGLGGLLMLGTRRGSRAGRHRGRRAPRPQQSFSLPVQAGARQTAVVLGALIALAAVGEAVLLLLPTTQTDTRTATVQQAGRWSYAATAAPSATYPTGTVSTGDPVYSRLARGLTVSFADTVSGAGVAGVTGTVRLDVGITSTDGWRATVTTGAPAPVTAGTATAAVAVDPAAATDLLARHVAEVGANGAAATLTVTPEVQLTGTVDGAPFTVDAPPALTFSLDPTTLRLSGAAAELTPTLPASVSVVADAPRTLGLLGVTVPLRVARLVVALLLAAVSVGWLVASRVGRPTGTGPAQDALVRLGARVLPVTALTPGAVVIDVEDVAALLRVAERLDCLVLHAEGRDGHTFAVQDQETTYRWTVPADGAPARPAEDLAAPLLRLA